MCHLLMTAPDSLLRRTVLELTNDFVFNRLIAIDSINAEPACTFFFDGIISNNIISLKEKGYNTNNIPEKYIYLNIASDSLPNISSQNKLLIIDAETEDPVTFSQHLQKHFSTLSVFSIPQIIAAACYYPAELCNLANRIENGNTVKPLLWSDTHLPSQQITAHTKVNFVF
ncbi:MAG: hypothetical protein JXR27_08110 [Paludibacteraceae bacterium]|nr:hypothetical protein [Paludibacteraceae bacterium]